MEPKLYVFFSNSAFVHTKEDRYAVCDAWWSAFPVYEAMCKEFLHVTMVMENEKGAHIMREYTNFPA